MAQSKKPVVEEAKAPTGIRGFDEITGGGLPRARVTVVTGTAGAGKTVFASQVLAQGIIVHGEPGIFVAFEENPERILAASHSMAWKLGSAKGKTIEFLDARLSQAVLNGGEFDLIGLLAVLSEKVRQLRAKRIVFDGIDMLLGHLHDPILIRRELFRLREWLDGSGLTSVITAKMERGGTRLAPDYEFLQFLADCVVMMHDRVEDGAALRALRVSKYRGSPHSNNEFPFTITESGIEVSTGATTALSYPPSTERVSSGIEPLDAMLSGGYHRGTAILMSGAPGTAKTTLAASFAAAACQRREKTLFVSFDEGSDQMIQNVTSVGIHLAPYCKADLLRLSSLRAHSDSPESHVARIRRLIRDFEPRNIIIDPLSAFARSDRDSIAEQAAFQIIDAAKTAGITVFATSLVANSAPLVEQTPSGISTVADTWIHVSYVGHAGERNRALTVIKSRGTGHSNQVRELVLSNDGVTLAEVYLAGGEVLMGTLRWEKEHRDRVAKDLARREAELREVQAEHALAETKARTEALSREQTIRKAELDRIRVERQADMATGATTDSELRRLRGDAEPASKSRIKAIKTGRR